MIRKILLAAGAAALMSTPAWAHPGQTPSNNGTGHGPSTPANDNHGNSGNGHGKGHSHKCVAHKVGYVADGTLVSQTLTKNSDGTYSGKVVVKVTHTNHHAAGDKEKTVEYTLENARVTFGLPDINKDGTVNLEDVAPGDRTHVIGKIPALAPKCEAKEEFKATVRKVVFHAPLSK